MPRLDETDTEPANSPAAPGLLAPGPARHHAVGRVLGGRALGRGIPGGGVVPSGTRRQ